jgi:hypothetical protein
MSAQDAPVTAGASPIYDSGTIDVIASVRKYRLPKKATI